MAGRCARAAAWSASAPSTASTSATGRWCGMPSREFFARANPPPRLTLPRDRIRMLLGHGLDHLGLLRFNAELAAMPAEDFVRRVLAGRLGAREVWIGPDFRFGHRRGGDLALLQAMGAELGFQAAAIDPVHVHG